VAIAQVVIIGGGIVGCSVAYHLTKRGWRDVVLLERASSPAAPPGTRPDWSASCAPRMNLTKLAQYTTGLYAGLEAGDGPGDRVPPARLARARDHEARWRSCGAAPRWRAASASRSGR
jgi:glycine/D-amino acid oxidase-like deaminating enzyme